MRSLKIFIVLFFLGCYVYAQETNKNEIISQYYIGAGYSFVNSYAIGNLLDFWQNRPNNDPNEEIEQATGIFSFRMGMQNCISQKHWVGTELQIVITPTHALWGTNLFYGGRNEIYYRAYFANICLTYGYAIDRNSKMLIVFEPGLDIGTMTGTISTTTDYYEQAFSVGLGGHGALGLDCRCTNNMSANIRIGYRFIKLDEMHKDESSSTGYSTFYVEGTSGETVEVDWSGSYMTIGITFSSNTKRK